MAIIYADLTNYTNFTEGMAAMKHEAKFSVILPAGSFTPNQTEAFEQAVQHYSIPAKLPLYADSKGNFVVSSGLCLRDAQLLRRQVSGCGFPADVVSDAAEAAAAVTLPKAPSLKSIANELSNVNVDTLNVDCDLPSDAWGSMELPSSLDLGLNDGEDLDKKSDWSGENWLSPDVSEHTLSVSAEVLLQKAKESTDEAQDAGNVKSDTDNIKSDTEIAVSPKKTASAASPIEAKNSVETGKKTEEGQKEAEAQSSQTPAVSPAPESLLQVAANKAKKAEVTPSQEDIAPATDKAPAETAESRAEAATQATDKSASENNKPIDSNALAQKSSEETENTALEKTQKKAFPANMILTVILVILIICLILALISAFVSPISALVEPLF